MDDDDRVLIDSIYEAAFAPEFWVRALQAASNAVGSRGAVFFAVDSQQTSWTSSPDIHGLVSDFVDEGWLFRNPRTERLAQAGHAGFLTDEDIYTRDELARLPIYTDFLWPRGIGPGAASIIAGPELDTLVLSFESFADTQEARKAKGRLDRLRPHLARAGLVAARLGLERARAATEALAALGLAAGVLGPSGRLTAANHLLEGEIPEVVRDGRDRCQLADPVADALLAETIDRRLAARSIPVAGDERRPPRVLHLLPMRGAVLDLFSRATSLLVVCPVVPRAGLPAHLLEVLYDLTPAEAKVAQLTARGASVPIVAEQLGLSVHTVRSQLKATFAKIGVERQSSLAALLMGSDLTGGRCGEL